MQTNPTMSLPSESAQTSVVAPGGIEINVNHNLNLALIGNCTVNALIDPMVRFVCVFFLFFFCLCLLRPCAGLYPVVLFPTLRWRPDILQFSPVSHKGVGSRLGKRLLTSPHRRTKDLGFFDVVLENFQNSTQECIELLIASSSGLILEFEHT